LINSKAAFAKADLDVFISICRMKSSVFPCFCFLVLPLILFSHVVFGQNNSLPESGIVYYRVLHFSFSKDADLSKLALAFDELNSSSVEVKCASLVNNQTALRLICTPEITDNQILLYSQKKGFEISLTSNELSDKAKLREYFRECKGLTKGHIRRITQADFDRLPEHKRAHIKSHPDLYIVE